MNRIGKLISSLEILTYHCEYWKKRSEKAEKAYYDLASKIKAKEANSETNCDEQCCK